MHNDLMLSQTCLNPILTLKDLRKLLQRAVLRLNEEEINKCEFQNIPEDEEEVVFPASAGEGDSCDESVVETSDVNPVGEDVRWVVFIIS